MSHIEALALSLVWLRGRPAADRVQDFATRAGLAVIMSLFIYSTLYDLAALGVFNWIAHIANAATAAHNLPN